MKKHNFIKYLGVVLLAAGVVSCSEDDETFDSLVKPVVSTATTDYTVAEGDDLIVTFTADKAIAESMNFKIEVVGGTATLHDDYDFNLDETAFSEGFGTLGYKFTIPAFTTSAAINVASFIKDADVDDGETLQLKVTATNNLNGSVVGGEQIINVTVTNAAQDVVNFTFDWDQTFNLFDTDYTLCEIAYDIDIVIADEAGNASYAAATADCPETFSLDLTATDPGTYDFYATLYDTAGLDFAGADTFEIPITVSFERPGSPTLGSGSFVQSSEYAYTSDSPSDPNAATLNYIGTVIVGVDGTVTIENDGTVIGSGRMAKAAKSVKKLTKANRVARPKFFN